MKNWIKWMAPAVLTASLFAPAMADAAYKNDVTVKKIASYTSGTADEDGGVAEIVKYHAGSNTFYVINGKNQKIDVVTLQKGTMTKKKEINVPALVNSNSFTYGDITSISIHGDHIAAAVQHEDYTKNGKIIVMDLNGKVLHTYEAGIQPDMVTFTEDGQYLLSANEGEPRMGLQNGVDPAGSVTIVNTIDGSAKQVSFTDESIIADDVHIRTGSAATDLEPEYIALSSDGSTAYVTLQENNAVAAINVANGTVQSIRSLGYKDHSKEENALDAVRDGDISIKPIPVLGAYMPDAISTVTVNGEDYLLTANEGDATEWEEFVNVADFGDWKENLAESDMKQTDAYDKLEVLTDRGTDAIYTLGSRSFSIWKADTLEQVFDSGSDFETITAERLPEYFNWSNDDDEMDKRSAKKGPEPEEIKTGIIDGKLVAMIGLERIGGVMTYDISDPENPVFLNYTNTRDFSDKIAGDVAPEGFDFISAQKSPTKKPILLVGNEVSGTVSALEYHSTSSLGKKAYINGFTDETFRPDQPVTRGELTAFLAGNLDISGSGSPFKDVPAGSRFADSIAAISAEGLIRGKSNGMFGSADPLTRAQFATIINRYMNSVCEDAAFASYCNAQPSTLNYIDMAEDHWADDAIYAVSIAGLMNGYGNDEFRPEKRLPVPKQ
ncbi:choice-of-anchor I family protein [Domibacillus sp. A3M-37]|uniref:choice-of-anchor I family protein n=1 Tax=Domibacillus sp. A3M-37 TaxID=2962037 RepID=UPI0020B64989|nr:choice-of-anchor I family protein [Domibacillus sp. A3M-37]MCP3761197.1 choice-of-anchor I family protein [Domibacillus sp. A3M-37]